MSSDRRENVFGAGAPETSIAPEARLTPRWEQREPTLDLGDRRPHFHTDSLETHQGWSMVGASDRGRLHAHEGTFREDAFEIECTDQGWHLVAVADGAGSHRLARVGSDLAVKSAVAAMAEGFGSLEPSADLAKATLQKALKASWMALRDEARKREVDFKDFGTTLLLLAFHPGRNLIGVAQVGDGLMAAQLEDRRIYLLGSPDTGEYSGQTLFLTNYSFDDLPSRVDAPKPPGSIQLLLTMTDGVADDLYPHKEMIPALARELAGRMAEVNPPQALLELIRYERPGSFDDRTLVVLCEPRKLANLRDESPAVTREETGDGCHAR